MREIGFLTHSVNLIETFYQVRQVAFRIVVKITDWFVFKIQRGIGLVVLFLHTSSMFVNQM